MADDKKSSDEYQYPPEEYYRGSDYTPDEEPLEPLESEEPISRRSPLMSRRFLLPLGFLVAIAIVYLVLTYRASQRSADLSQPTPTPEVAQASIPSTQTAPVLQQPAVTQPMPDPAAQAYQRLAQQNQANQQAISGMQSQVQQLQSQVSDLSNSITTLNNQLQVIANEIRAIALDRATKGRNLSLPTGTMYYLKAVVPGRAWLQSKSGSTTTVTLGDRLPGYGIIQMINTQQGIVTTSSGLVIEYGPKDT